MTTPCKTLVDKTLSTVNEIVLGKPDEIKIVFACLLAGGHLLLEDLPGTGKTTLALTLAKILGLDYTRIQFTSDLLPADITGISIFDQKTAEFEFRKGPVFSQMILADEVNRATPKTQGALLEAMEEGQVTIDGETHLLPKPFFVIATQNPVTQLGTYPLPESQLDRFLMRISLGYLDMQAERDLLTGEDRRALLAAVEPVMAVGDLFKLQLAVKAVHASETVIDYVQRLVHYTRTTDGFSYGLSSRGALALLRAAKSIAFVHGRTHIIPEDVQQVLPAVVEHRLRRTSDPTGHDGQSLADRMLSEVDVL